MLRYCPTYVANRIQHPAADLTDNGEPPLRLACSAVPSVSRFPHELAQLHPLPPFPLPFPLLE